MDWRKRQIIGQLESLAGELSRAVATNAIEFEDRCFVLAGLEWVRDTEYALRKAAEWMLNEEGETQDWQQHAEPEECSPTERVVVV